MATGTSNFNIPLLSRKGITLANVPEYSTEGVAELTISALLNITRKTHDAMNFVKNGGWGFEKFTGTELKGKTLGIIGMGNIGSRVAEIARSFGMKVAYFSRTRKPRSEAEGIAFLELQELLRQSDVISLHCKLTGETANILNKSNLGLMKQGAILLNSARSELVDPDALYEFCMQKKIIFWSDVLENDKLRARFAAMDNIYLTPHFGWMTKEAQQRLRKITLQNIQSHLDGMPQNKVT